MSQEAPRFLITSEHPGAAYDTAVVAFILALKANGVAVSVMVHGDHLERSLILSRLIGRNVRCISKSMMLHGRAVSEIITASLGSELLLIIGSGLDPYEAERSPDLELAEQLRMSVVVISPKEELDPRYKLDDFGYILYESEASLGKTIAVIDLNRVDKITLPLGVSQAKSITIPNRNQVRELSQIAQVNIEKVKKFANSASRVKASSDLVLSGKITRIAVTDDPCFCLSYQNNIDLLNFCGADLIKVSPLVDTKLPDNIGALYISGAILSEYAEDLSANKSFFKSILDFYEAGGVIYSEGAGTSFLCKQYSFSNTRIYPGVNILAARARWQYSTKHRLLEAETIEDSILGSSQERYTSLVTNEWKFTELEHILKLTRMVDRGGDPIMDGLSPGPQVFCTQGFIQMASNPRIAKKLVQAASVKFKYKSQS